MAGLLIGHDVDGANPVGYLTGQVGSVTATTNTSGAVVNTYRPKPYGQRLAKTGAAADPPFEWAGNSGSRRTGLSHAEQYNQARHYDCITTRWTTVDPLWPGEPQYTYVDCNPILHLDPSGLYASSSQQTKEEIEETIRRGRIARMSCEVPSYYGRATISVCLSSRPCVNDIMSKWWPMAAHYCNSGYAHCMACCTLTRQPGGAACAEIFQTLQNERTGNGPDQEKMKKFRSIYCNSGIEIGLKPLPKDKTNHQDCSDHCIKLYPFKKPNPRRSIIPGTGKTCDQLDLTKIKLFPALDSCK
jgi:RHS repeat-associated protein